MTFTANDRRMLTELHEHFLGGPVKPPPPDRPVVTTLHLDLGDGWTPTERKPTYSEVIKPPVGKRVLRTRVDMIMEGEPDDPRLWNLLVWFNAAKKSGAGINGDMALYGLWRRNQIKWRQGFTGDHVMTNDQKKGSLFNGEMVTSFRHIADYAKVTNTIWWNGMEARSNDTPQLIGEYAGKHGLHISIGGVATPGQPETAPFGVIFREVTVMVETEK